jgi:ATP-dependent RNA helicase SUPV3L1/SUV3
MKRLAQKEELMSTVEEDGAIHVEGEYVGRISGFHFLADGSGEGAEARALKAAALSAVAAEILARAKAVAASPDTSLKLTRDGQIIWNAAAIGKLEAGAALLKPRAVVLAGDQLSGADREEVQARLQKFVDRQVAATLEPLVKLEEGEGLEGIARGLAFRLSETLGVLPRDQVSEEIKTLPQEDRAKLRALGARFGAFHVFVPVMLKPAATELRLLLWALQLQKDGKLDLANLPLPPGQGLTSALFDRSTPRGFYGICGYRICGNRVVRIDMLERLADLIRDRVFWRPRFPDEARPAGSVEGGGFAIVPDMMSLVGCSGEDFVGILKSLDFRVQKKKIKRPVAPAPVTEDAPAASAETEMAVVGDAPEEPQTQSEPAPVVIDVSTAESQSPLEAAAPDPLAVPSPDPVLEEVEIEVWWPKDTGPFRHRAEKPKDQPHRRIADAGDKKRPERAKRDGAPRREGRKPQREDRPPREERKPRPERPIDPDSPFAVLGALKAKLAGKS